MQKGNDIDVTWYEFLRNRVQRINYKFVYNYLCIKTAGLELVKIVCYHKLGMLQV